MKPQLADNYYPDNLVLPTFAHRPGLGIWAD